MPFLTSIPALWAQVPAGRTQGNPRFGLPLGGPRLPRPGRAAATVGRFIDTEYYLAGVWLSIFLLLPGAAPPKMDAVASAAAWWSWGGLTREIEP